MKEFLAIMKFEYGGLDPIYSHINCDFEDVVRFIEIPKCIKRVREKYGHDDLDTIIVEIEDTEAESDLDNDMLYEFWSAFIPLTDSGSCYELTGLEIYRVTDHEVIL